MVYPLVRQASSGPVIGQGTDFTGFIVQQNTDSIAVTNGAISAATLRFISVDMTTELVVLQAELEQVKAVNLIQFEAGFDIEVTDPDYAATAMQVTLECSRDAGATWNNIVAPIERTWPVGTRIGRFQFCTPALIPTVVNGYLDGDTIQARIRVVGGAGDIVVLAEDVSTTYITLRELLA